MAEPIPLPARAPSPVAPVPAGNAVPRAIRETMRRNPFIVRHMGARRPRRGRTLVAGAALLAALLTATGFVLAPGMASGLLTVALTGLTAWCCAAAADRRPAASDRPRAANDNPSRPRLPLPALPC